MSTWIKRSEREPMQADFPILGGAYVLGGNKAWDEDYCQDFKNVPSYFTHWRSIKCEPPARELTQREKDRALVEKMEYETIHLMRDAAMLEAIYAERREVDRLLTSWFGKGWTTESFTKESSLGQLRARLDEQGGGK